MVFISLPFKVLDFNFLVIYFSLEISDACANCVVVLVILVSVRFLFAGQALNRKFWALFHKVLVKLNFGHFFIVSAIQWAFVNFG